MGHILVIIIIIIICSPFFLNLLLLPCDLLPVLVFRAWVRCLAGAVGKEICCDSDNGSGSLSTLSDNVLIVVSNLVDD